MNNSSYAIINLVGRVSNKIAKERTREKDPKTGQGPKVKLEKAGN
jgi:hypothetical protein